jgi:hypothetical protein
MGDAATAPIEPADFIRRWEGSGAAERANYALFLTELCDLLRVARPEPTRPDDTENAYVFERSVTFQNGDGTTSAGRIDLYKRGCFVLEAKQGSERPEADEGLTLTSGPTRRARRRGTAVRGTAGWDDAMLAARGQAEQYVKALPASEPNPPFLIVVDVGHTVELFTDFTRQGRTYTPFPDALTHRIKLPDLAREEIRERLGAVWTDPLSLDPSRRAAKVTREVAARLAKLAQSLERSGHTPEAGAQFLMRCLFTFFAEDVGLLPKEGFTTLLRSLRDGKQTPLFPDMVRSLWETMKTGGFSPLLRAPLLRFNGGLFESPDALPVTDEQLDLLIQAGEKEWRDVEPAIFGTLLERALSPVERHKLGAHYTPRAYVERLVMPTIIEPLRDKWANVLAAAVTLAKEGKLSEARDEVRAFLRKLCDTTVLDPACGTGNFLYVTLEHMKRLEGEVWDALRGFGETQAAFEGFGLTVDPHQLLGIEINPRAAAIADLVLWIGYLQWHFHTFGNLMPAEPIIHAYHNIECRDAVLDYDRIEPALDEHDQTVTRWDGRTMKRHPVTGEVVPDESVRVPVLRYVDPRKAGWPKTDYVVGNPPFLGKLYMLDRLGEDYVEALRAAYSQDVPDGCDFVMYWWWTAARLVASGGARRFGLISTKSIGQSFNRRVAADALAWDEPIHIAFAIPNHPWVDTQDCAAVRIAMTVGASGHAEGELATVVSEQVRDDGESHVVLESARGLIREDLRIGANVAGASMLRANLGIAGTGLILGGRGFVLASEEFGRLSNESPESLGIVFPLRHGRDLMDICRNAYVIDTCGLDESELMSKFPDVYQRLRDRVYPERQGNRDPRLRRQWWLFRRSNQQIRDAIRGLPRYIATSETSRHRVFVFLSSEIKPEHKLVVIGSDDALMLGALPCRIHSCWALAAGGRLGVGDDPVYSKNTCYEKFPFPDWTEAQMARVRELGEALDAHRRRQQVIHPTLTLTDVYNVLAKLRTGELLTDKERAIHEQGLVSVLKQIHENLDAAVFDAYGWPHDLTDDEILHRLVDLNRERAAEEARKIVRWLRPEFQNPEGAKAATQATLPIETEAEPAPIEPAATPAKKQPWPKSLAEQAQAVRAALSAYPGGLTPEQLAKTFLRARVDRVSELLETLVSLGQARVTDDGRFVRS